MPRDLVLVALSLFTWGIGEGMFIYFQPLYLQKWGAKPLEIGAILSMVGIAMALAQAPAGYLSDRIGSRPVMFSAWVIGFAATLIMALAGSLAAFVAGLMIYSVTSFVNAPMNSYIVSMRGKLSPERALTIVSAMLHMGTVAGPVLGGLIGQAYGLQPVYRISAGIFFVSTLIILLARRPPARQATESHASPLKLAANSRFMSLLGILSLTMFALYLPQPLAPVYLKDQQGFSVGTIGLLGSVASLSNALVMLALGSLRATAGMLAGQILVGLFALLMWQGKSQPVFFIGYFLLGGYRLCRSMAIVLARRLVKESETGLAFGLVETGNAVSVIAAPLAAGFLYNRSPQSMFIASLAAISLMLGVHLLRLPGRQAPALSEMSED